MSAFFRKASGWCSITFVIPEGEEYPHCFGKILKRTLVLPWVTRPFPKPSLWPQVTGLGLARLRRLDLGGGLRMRGSQGKLGFCLRKGKRKMDR